MRQGYLLKSKMKKLRTGDEEAQKQYEEILAKEKARRERDRESNKKSYRKRKEKARAIEEAAKAGDPEALKEYEKILEERRKEAERAKKWRDKQKNSVQPDWRKCSIISCALSTLIPK